jgi:hypothetical protein
MAPTLDFDVEEFVRLPLKERVELCKRLAARAEKMADATSAEHRAHYLTIANQWRILAADMEEEVRSLG